MSSFTVVFTTPGTRTYPLAPDDCRRPGWTVIEGCTDMDDAISFFLDHRGRDGIPVDAEIDNVHPTR